MGRHKPGKPRRPRPAGAHAHRGWPLDEVPQPGSWRADSKLFEDVTDAAFEGCASCQDAALTLLVEDAVTTARLVSNETKAFAPLLDTLDLTDTLVTADAMQTTRANARYTVGRGGRYLLPVKFNQPTLYAQLDRLPWESTPVSHATTESDHGR